MGLSVSKHRDYENAFQEKTQSSHYSTQLRLSAQTTYPTTTPRSALQNYFRRTERSFQLAQQGHFGLPVATVKYQMGTNLKNTRVALCLTGRHLAEMVRCPPSEGSYVLYLQQLLTLKPKQQSPSSSQAQRRIRRCPHRCPGSPTASLPAHYRRSPALSRHGRALYGPSARRPAHAPCRRVPVPITTTSNSEGRLSAILGGAQSRHPRCRKRRPRPTQLPAGARDGRR